MHFKYDDEYIAEHYHIDMARTLGVMAGDGCRFYTVNFSTEPYLIKIGNHVTLEQNVSFSTHDGGVWVFRDEDSSIELFGRITIGNNVYIGMNSTILLNTRMGNNSIVSEGSVVKGK